VDVLLKLRVLIWVLVISLWGVMVYQYLGEDEKVSSMRPVAYRPAEATAPAPDIPAPDAPAPPRDDAAAPVAATPSVAVSPPLVVPGPSADPTRIISAPPEAAGPAPPSRDDGNNDDDSEPVIVLPAPRPASPARPTRVARLPRPSPRSRPARQEDRSIPLPDPPVPPGFQKSVTRHFNVYSEQYPASDAFLELVENLHGNLMLDLAPFSPWANDQRVSIFLFKNQNTYRRMTGRPAWSGGASSVPKRKVYIFESEELPGILAHELTHIYFDGFFLDGANDPLWLSEGMATLVQVERGLSAPNWLRDNLAILESGRRSDGRVHRREDDVGLARRESAALVRAGLQPRALPDPHAVPLVVLQVRRAPARRAPDAGGAVPRVRRAVHAHARARDRVAPRDLALSRRRPLAFRRALTSAPAPRGPREN